MAQVWNFEDKIFIEGENCHNLDSQYIFRSIHGIKHIHTNTYIHTHCICIIGHSIKHLDDKKNILKRCYLFTFVGIRLKSPIKFIEMLNGASVEKISTKNEPDVKRGQKCRLAILLFLFLYKELYFAFISLDISVLLSVKVIKEGPN